MALLREIHCGYVLWEYGGDAPGSFGICVRMPPPGPANDDPCGAFELPVATTCTYQTFTNESSFGSSGVPAPGCGFYQGGDVWFKAVVPAEGAITFDTQAGDMTDGGMAVYTGTCDNLTLVECDEDDGAGNMPKMTIGGLNPGDTVWVRVWEEGGDNNGTFGICLTVPPPPPSTIILAELLVYLLPIVVSIRLSLMKDLWNGKCSCTSLW